jgi:hypothetical protein
MRKALALSLPSAAFLLLAACSTEHPVSLTSTTSAGLVTNDDAVNLLTARRCEREIDCKNVGDGKHYDDRGGCERELVHELQAELGSNACASGLREAKLDRCLKDIRGASCLAPLDRLDRVASCRTSQLCIN